MGDILVAKGGQQCGPFTAAEIHRKVLSGELSRADLWWKEGNANWEPLSTLLPRAEPPPMPCAVPPPFPPGPSAKSPGGVSPWVIILGIFGGGVAILVVISIVAAIVIPIIASRSRETARVQSERTPPALAPNHESWREVSLDGLRLQSPLEMEPKEIALEGENSAATKKLIVSWNSMQGESEGLYVIASVVTYQEGVQLSLDGATSGAMEGMAAKVKVPVPDYHPVERTVSGFPARRVETSFDAEMAGRKTTIAIRALFIHAGQRLLQVITIQFVPGEEETARAQALLASVSVATP